MHSGECRQAVNAECQNGRTLSPAAVRVKPSFFWDVTQRRWLGVCLALEDGTDRLVLNVGKQPTLCNTAKGEGFRAVGDFVLN